MARALPRHRTLQIALLAIGLAVTTVVATPAPVAADPTLTLSDSTDLSPGDVVTVDGAGLSATSGALVLCLAGATQSDQCDLGTARLIGAPDGTFTFEFPMARDIAAIPFGSPAGTPRQVHDCAVVACELVLSTDSVTPSARAGLTFLPTARPTPSLSIDPIPAVDDVEVTGEGLPGARTVQVAIRECPTGSSSCSLRTFGTAQTDPDGSLEHTVPANQLDDMVLTCMDGDCSVEIQIPQVLAAPAVVVISTPPVIDIADLDVQVDPFATFDADRNEVVATATVTCDQPTPVAVSANLVQGDTVWHHRVTWQQCTPTAPLTVWIPSRALWAGDGAFDPSQPVEVEGEVSPLRGTFYGLGPDIVGTVDLVDHDAVIAYVVAAMQQPGNEDLVAEVLTAIAARAKQDPVFAAQLFNR